MKKKIKFCVFWCSYGSELRGSIRDPQRSSYMMKERQRLLISLMSFSMYQNNLYSSASCEYIQSFLQAMCEDGFCAYQRFSSWLSSTRLENKMAVKTPVNERSILLLAICISLILVYFEASASAEGYQKGIVRTWIT